MVKQVHGAWLPDREERWKRHPEHTDYEISSEGRVKRVTPSRGTRVGKILRPGIGSHGYLSVVLGGQARLVHRLVLEAFVGPQPLGCEALHDDDYKPNCCLDNLSWGTRAENMFDRARNGTGRYGSRSSQAKLTETNVVQIRARAAGGEKMLTTLAREFGVCDQLIGMVVRRQRWAHV